MSQITGGRVVFSRTVQPAQYESKRAEVVVPVGKDFVITAFPEVKENETPQRTPTKKPDRSYHGDDGEIPF